MDYSAQDKQFANQKQFYQDIEDRKRRAKENAPSAFKVAVVGTIGGTIAQMLFGNRGNR